MQLRRDWKLIRVRVANLESECDKLSIAPSLITMLIAAEDHRFGSHPGVDPISICRAVWKSLFCGKSEGGSTIAMQLVRVITGRYERTFKRKILEIYLAVRLTNYVCEADLPKLYLVVAYFGWNMDGLAQAAQRLNVDLTMVSKLEAANIIARLKYPEPQGYNEKRLRKIRKRTKHILLRADALIGMPPNQLELNDINGSV